MMLPGLESDPKNSGLDERALERFTNNDVLPSNPTIGLDSVTWNAAAVFPIVTLASPFAKNNNSLAPSGDPDEASEKLTIYPVWLIWVPRE